MSSENRGNDGVDILQYITWSTLQRKYELNNYIDIMKWNHFDLMITIEMKDFALLLTGSGAGHMENSVKPA